MIDNAAAPHLCRLSAQAASARRVTVIPVAADGGLVTVAGVDLGDPALWTFPSAIKVHPRVRAVTIARRLLDNLGCHHTDLHMVAVFDPEPGRVREIVYSAYVTWSLSGSLIADNDRVLLRTTSTAATRQARARPGGASPTFAQADLANPCHRLPDLRCSAGHVHV